MPKQRRSPGPPGHRPAAAARPPGVPWWLVVAVVVLVTAARVTRRSTPRGWLRITVWRSAWCRTVWSARRSIPRARLRTAARLPPSPGTGARPR